MPCYDSRNETSNVRAEAALEWRHNSPVAELLCEAMQLIGYQKMEFASPALVKWWQEHQVRDAHKEANGP